MSDTSFNLGPVIEDAKKVILDPVGFYKNMPLEGGFINPLIFGVVMAAITGLVTAVLSIIGLGMGAGVGGAGFSAIIIFPISIAIGGFISAGVLFVVWKLMGSDKNYEAAYRCIAYSTTIGPVMAIVSIIPYLGVIVRAFWGFFLMYTASVEVHKISEKTSKTVFGVLAALALIMGIASERAMRNFDVHSFQTQKELFDRMENMEDIDAEEAGKMMGEFLKGMKEAAEKAEKED